MQKEGFCFTAGQFAKLHHLNKRTLHYYDDIGLFSPAHKGDNGYRYYTWHQSAQLENILALRELGMSIEEVKRYLRRPNTEQFLQIAGQKTQEIDRQIRRLRQLRDVLQEKQDALSLCLEVYDGKIEVRRRPKDFVLLTPLHTGSAASSEMEQVMLHLQKAWEYSAYKTGCGSYLSLAKAAQGQFDYDGLFTPVSGPGKHTGLPSRPEGEYLCAYCIGDWEKIPALYARMLRFAKEERLPLTGCCYESGLNEFAISGMDEYVTRIEIAIKR